MTLTLLLSLIPAVGLFGSAIELVGKVTGSSRLQSVGKVLEGACADVPKVVSNVFSALKGK